MLQICTNVSYLANFKICYKTYFFLQIIWLYQKYAVPLHRVFHGIRFKVK